MDFQHDIVQPKRSYKNCLTFSVLGLLATLVIGGITVGILVGSNVIHTKSTTEYQIEMSDPETIDIIETTYKTVNNTPFQVDNGTFVLFYDEFDGTTLDETKWSSNIPYGWYSKKDQQQIYTSDPENVNVNNGSLNIIATNNDGVIDSGWVDSHDLFNFYPGMIVENKTMNTVRLDTRIKTDHNGQGLWPAFWLAPSDHLRYGDSPGSGEMDIMETINSMTNMNQVAHYGSVGYHVMNKSDNFLPKNAPWVGEYHDYSMIWSLNNITFTIDNRVTLSIAPRSATNPNGWFTDFPGASATAPFDKPFYIIMNFFVCSKY
jgi:hypothetical protein